MRIIDWSSDVCSSDLPELDRLLHHRKGAGDDRLTRNNRRAGGENDQRKPQMFRSHQVKGILGCSRVRQKQRRLAGIVDQEGWKQTGRASCWERGGEKE